MGEFETLDGTGLDDFLRGHHVVFVGGWIAVFFDAAGHFPVVKECPGMKRVKTKSLLENGADGVLARRLGRIDCCLVCRGVIQTILVADNVATEFVTYLLDVAGQSVDKAGRSGPRLAVEGRVIVFYHVVVELVNSVADSI